MPPTTAADLAPRKVTVIRPARRFSNLRHLGELWEFREVVRRLGGRDLTLRYRQTALGVAWVVLQPLLAAGILSFVFGKIANLPGPAGVPYFVFSFGGMLVYTLFNSTTTRACYAPTANATLVSRTYFPRLLLPLSTIVSVVVDTAVALAMLGVMMAIVGIWPGWPVVAVPFFLGVTLVMGEGVGLLGAAYVVRYRDVGFVLPVLLQFALYASPVAYTLDQVPAGPLRTLFELNPLVSVIEGFRWAALGTPAPPLWMVVYGTVAAVVIFAVGLVVFSERERKFADVI